MDYQLNTRLNGNIAMTSRFHENKPLQRDKTLYKFLWVQSGTLVIEVDHIPMKLAKDEIVTLTPLHHLTIKEVAGEFLTFVFNSNFYCIYGHDNEVSCNGFLFYGSSRVMRLKLSEEQSSNLHDIVREKESGFEIVRQYYNLVDEHFRTKKQVQDYADMLHKSPKTLSNIFSTCKLPSPLRVIHERVEAEAKRLLLYSNKSAKEIADILGFEDQASFSRFFKNISGQSAVQFRNTQEGKN